MLLFLCMAPLRVTQIKIKKALKLCSNFIAKNIFTKQATIQKSATKFSYLLSDKLMKQSKPFSDGAFLKDCSGTKKAADFTYFFIVLDESTDIKATAQLLIFIQGINDRFEIVEEFLAMEWMRGTTRGSDFYDRLSGCFERLNLP